MWAKVDDGWWCHPKVMGLPLAARGLWVSALSWSCAQRQDLVPPSLLMMVGGSNAEAKELVDAGLWHEVEGGWQIHDWADYQDRSLAEKRADAGRRGGLASGEARRAKAEAEANEATDRSKAEANAEAGALPVPSLPDLEPTPTVTDVDEPRLLDPPGSSARAEGRGRARSSEPDLADEFATWWAGWPRKVSRADAAKAYRQARTGRLPGDARKGPVPSAAELLEARDRQAAIWRREGRPAEKIPHAATWLNGRRWEDEALTQPPEDPPTSAGGWVER